LAAKPTLPAGKPLAAPTALRLPSYATLNETICRLLGASAKKRRCQACQWNLDGLQPNLCTFLIRALLQWR
jgi:hypothetical protein